MAQHGGGGILQRNAVGAFKHLHHAAVAPRFNHPAGANLAGFQLQLNQLVEPDVRYMRQHNQRSVDFLQSLNLDSHTASPSFRGACSASSFALISSQIGPNASG